MLTSDRSEDRTISSPFGVWRIVSEDSLNLFKAFPADYLQPFHFHLSPIYTFENEEIFHYFLRKLRFSHGEVGWYTQTSQHIARFYNYSGPFYSYGRRLLGLRFGASLPPEGGNNPYP